MKMICKNCQELFPEEEMIKMSQHDYEMKTQKEGQIISYSLYDTARYCNYVAICENCYKRLGKWNKQ